MPWTFGSSFKLKGVIYIYIYIYILHTYIYRYTLIETEIGSLLPQRKLDLSSATVGFISLPSATAKPRHYPQNFHLDLFMY